MIRTGVAMERTFTKAGVHPYDEIEWKRTDVIIDDYKTGGVVFEQRNIEVPTFWEEGPTAIVASKYFHGAGETRENSARQLVNRVVDTIADHGELNGYFQSPEDAQVFRDELTYLLINQVEAFNSPVWFNVGVHTREPNNKSQNWHWNPTKLTVERAATGYNNPQCSACFINSVGDSMESILDLAKTEGMLFKYGSGAGSNLSAIRGANEALSGGGTASGPLSFMRGFDAFAGVIKSGGKTRRAAKMVILNSDHPDILEFIGCKGKEEAKAVVLTAAGYDGNGPDSEAYSSIFFQNANNSVRVTDEFMQAALEGKDWNLTARKDGRVVKTVKAADLLRQIAAETWACGDPGMQFDTTINKWHTSKTTGRINASNPCSEYMFLDDTSCNLASINLVKFLGPEGVFDIRSYKAAIRTSIIAMDILVDKSGYPTELIARNSHDFRPLGLGYANLGALLLHMGLPYDSDEGRNVAAALTAIMGGEAYKTSAELAGNLETLVPAGTFTKTTKNGAFPGFADNEDSFREVMAMHHKAAKDLYARFNSPLAEEAEVIWSYVANPMFSWAGFRNSQVTVLAPTGTIGFMMGCDTTGIEPMLAIVVFKKLVGGGSMKLVVKGVPNALKALGYTPDQVKSINDYVTEHGTVEGAPELRKEHLPVFDSAFTPKNGKRSISWRGHVGMMAATQPFLSGAISKTVNLPHEATVEDIEAAYVESWKLSLKAVAIYRDGSKGGQPMAAASKDGKKKKEEKPAVVAVAPVNQPDLNAPPVATRHRLPEERAAVTHKFNIGMYEGYITVGLFPNGQPGEIFIKMAKEGSTISGLMDSFATNFSIGLQYGVPLKVMTDKMRNTSFEPSGFTGSEEFGRASSIMDYIGRWLQARFGEGIQLSLFNNHAQQVAGVTVQTVPPAPVVRAEEEKSLTDLVNSSHRVREDDVNYGDAPMCPNCGGQMKQAGKCHTCLTCGTSNGCS
jgi:ribonucleoside-diphosphate reductase alpha chain